MPRGQYDRTKFKNKNTKANKVVPIIAKSIQVRTKVVDNTPEIVKASNEIAEVIMKYNLAFGMSINTYVDKVSIAITDRKQQTNYTNIYFNPKVEA